MESTGGGSAHGGAGVAGRWWQRRVVAPIRTQLTQGVAPEQIALAVALGATVGIFPVLGSTTVLCALVGVWLRLNQPVLQLVNYLVYPLQLLLLVPFCRAGEMLFGQPHLPILSVAALVERFEASPGQFLVDYGQGVLLGAAVWCLLAPPLAALVYWGLRPLLRRLA